MRQKSCCVAHRRTIPRWNSCNSKYMDIRTDGCKEEWVVEQLGIGGQFCGAGWMTKIILTTATTMPMAIWTRSRSFCFAAMRAFNLSRSEYLHYNILCGHLYGLLLQLQFQILFIVLRFGLFLFHHIIESLTQWRYIRWRHMLEFVHMNHKFIASGECFIAHLQ